MPIENRQEIENIVRAVLDRLGLGGNIGGLLAGGFLKLTGNADYKVNWGVTDATFTASATSATQTIDHGLDREPTYIAVVPRAPLVQVFNVLMDTHDATQFTFRLREYQAAAVSGTQNLFWVAIG